MATGVYIFFYAFVNPLQTFGVQNISSLDFWIDYFVFQFGFHAVFGANFGLVYSRFYKRIPGEGVMKGLVFGLMVGMLANLHYSSFWFLNWFLLAGEVEWLYPFGIGWLEGFLKWIPYGIVLGIVYDRLKL
jgi:hypothetical protein